MKQNILLLGGTGAMGTHLIQLFNGTQNEIYVTSRRQRENHDNIHYILGNAHKIEFLNKLLQMKNWDIIVDFMIYSTTEFRNRAEQLLTSCKQYVFLSSSRVYADTQPFIEETSPRLLDVSTDKEYLTTDEYALSKARSENVLLQSKHKNWTIIRPYITYSEERLQLGVLEKEDWLYRVLRGQTLVFSRDIASKVTTLTYGFDVAKGIKAIIGEKSALGQIFHITSDENHTWQEIFDLYIKILTKHLGHKPKILIINENPRVPIKCSNPQVIYDRYFDRRFDNSKIKKYIDTSDFMPTMQGLSKCLEEFLTHPKFKMTGWGSQAMYDRMTGEWTTLSEIPTWTKRVKYLLRRTIMPKK
jgi:nucleoside-diphosphate-sugar epimerase